MYEVMFTDRGGRAQLIALEFHACRDKNQEGTI